MNTDFSNIRAYEDEDFSTIVPVLLADEQFMQFLGMLSTYIYQSKEAMPEMLAECKSIDDFDKNLIIPFLQFIVKQTATSLDIHHTENLSSAGALYLSNHRDIILDASLLAMLVRRYNNKRIYMGMGTNLYVLPCIEPLVRLAKCYSVIRGGTPKEMLANSMRLSAYMHQIIVEKKQSAWLAQREGRAKDSNDLTQPALIKMLLLASKEESLCGQLEKLNITPVAITYEYDPCDYLKAQELQIRRDNNNVYHKTKADDYESMKQGLLGKKGRINYVICKSINSELPKVLSATTIRNEQIRTVCELIDNYIHRNYFIYNTNRIAYDLLYEKRFNTYYTEAERNDFVKYIESRIDMIKIEHKDCDFLRTTLLNMYANPLVNQLKLL
ncbi:MAG: 1-acyl-sn-glycerol-3-phosphate acyltransferase [Paludibacteraceae bacterium]|nr:1-acyl-sn-glycerol-3-phosphate acyltransferase [Paludibacteraceae bacterium]